jgi:hypothetical protein
MNITEQQLQEFMQEVSTNGLDATVQKIKAAAAPPPEPPDYSEQEQAELKNAHGWRQVNQVQEKYYRLRNPQQPPAVRVDKELEAHKAAGTLEDLYEQRLAKIRRGDVNAIVRLKLEMKQNGLEVS